MANTFTISLPPSLYCGCISALFPHVYVFDAVGWAAGRASGLYETEWWGAGMVISLGRGAVNPDWIYLSGTGSP